MVEKTTADAASSTEAAVSAENAEQVKPIAKLLGSITYDNEEDWELFLNTMTPQQVIIVLIAATRYAQSRGAYTLEESELISRAIKRMKVHSDAATKDLQKEEQSTELTPETEQK